jgi:SnoaL-like domain
MPDHARIASDYIRAVGHGRLDEVATYLHPDVTFETPGGARTSGANQYLAALRRLGPIIAGNEIRSVLADGDRVCILYDFVTATPVGPVVSAEWLTFTEGRIASVYLLFDKARWPEVLAQLEAVSRGA